MRRLPALPSPPAAAALAAALAAAALAVAACGDGYGTGDGEPAGRAATVPAGKPVVVVGDEYSFDPARVTVEGGGRGGPVEIVLRNEGALAHNLKLFAGDRDLGGTPTFQGGGRARSGTVELAPGRYRMVCTVGDHERLGMVGTLEVR